MSVFRNKKDLLKNRVLEKGERSWDGKESKLWWEEKSKKKKALCEKRKTGEEVQSEKEVEEI